MCQPKSNSVTFGFYECLLNNANMSDHPKFTSMQLKPNMNMWCANRSSCWTERDCSIKLGDSEL